MSLWADIRNIYGSLFITRNYDYCDFKVNVKKYRYFNGILIL